MLLAEPHQIRHAGRGAVVLMPGSSEVFRQVALVLAIWIVDHDDHPPRLKLPESLLDARKFRLRGLHTPESGLAKAERVRSNTSPSKRPHLVGSRVEATCRIDAVRPLSIACSWLAGGSHTCRCFGNHTARSKAIDALCIEAQLLEDLLIVLAKFRRALR